MQSESLTHVWASGLAGACLAFAGTPPFGATVAGGSAPVSSVNVKIKYPVDMRRSIVAAFACGSQSDGGGTP